MLACHTNGMDASDSSPADAKKETGIGPMAGAIIIVILVALGGIYFLYQENVRVHTPPVQENLNA